MPRVSLTPRRQQVYNFIVKFKQTHDGVSPSVSEIREGCGISSNSMVVENLHALEQLGMIECGYGSGKSRMIMVCGGRWIPPSQNGRKVSPGSQGARGPFSSLTTE